MQELSGQLVYDLRDEPHSGWVRVILDTDPERLACDSPSATDLGDGLVRFSDGSVCLTRDGVAASIQSDGDNDWTDAEVIALAREFQPSTVEWLLEQDR